MLQISQATMTGMLDRGLSRIAPVLAEYLRENHGEATAGVDDRVLLDRTLFGLQRARAWGFESQFGLTLFVALMFEIHPDFDSHPKIRALLTDTSRLLDERIAAIEDALNEQEWEALACSPASGAKGG